MSLSDRERSIRLKLKNDFEHYALRCLKIRTKEGSIEPFNLNKAQRYIHAKIENQLHQTGKVRALILKGRQQGCSTYVEARYYWKTSHRKGVKTFILTHEQAATDNLFKLASRYHEHCPSLVRPSTGAASTKELHFDRLDSGYSVGTAGSKGVGRSSTIQYFHGSEVAFWPHADTHAVGVMQAIPDADDTEVILESTANGLGNYFHKQWKAAEAGLSDYLAIFVPWFWQDEYRKDVDEYFECTEEENELKRQFDLDDKQIAWRRNKIIELSAGGVDGETQFRQEYPMNAAEAFQMSGANTLIRPQKVMECRANKVKGVGAKILGVDPSHGGDRFAIIRRQGRKLYKPETFVRDQVDTLQKRAALIIQAMEDETFDAVFVDSGFGADLVDYLRGLGSRYKIVKAISFASTPHDTRRYKNKRAEMWGRLAEWIADENETTQVPDDDELQADICACPYRVDVDNKIQLLPKEKIKEELGYSPDIGDAAALTFAETVRPKEHRQAQQSAQMQTGFSVY